MIAGSDHQTGEGDLLGELVASGVIDSGTAAAAADIFKHGGRGAFLCAADSKTDNICVTYLSENNYVLVQTFPKNVTQNMIMTENLVGIRLESVLIGLFAVYIAALLIRAGKKKKALEKENREMGYITGGFSTLFNRFTMVDLEKNTYQYLAGTKPENNGLEVSGKYDDLKRHLCSILLEEEARQEFSQIISRENIIEALKERDDIRYECHVLRGDRAEWEHMNVICLERKDKRAGKVLFIRQNVTDIKEKELKIQAEMALANRKERQYRIAIASSAFSTFEFNLTRDLIENDVTRMTGGEQMSLLEKSGLKAPCRASEYLERWKEFVLEESLKIYEQRVNTRYLKERFEQGDAEVVSLLS